MINEVGGSVGAARSWDAVPVALAGGPTLVHLTHYYTGYWQAVRGVTAELDVPAEFPATFPRESVVELLAGVSNPDYALVMANYVGGVGDQWACVRTGGRFRAATDINAALRALGVRAGAGQDEFDTVGLVEHRMSPEYLDGYEDLCEGLGV